MLRIIDFVHNIIKEKVNSQDICVDMTLGNGNDTLFLCGLAKHVYGFDIQKQAIEKTDLLLSLNNYKNYTLFLSSHENVDEIIKEKIKAFIFNLGYLPGGDKSITTNYQTTINAISNSLKLLDDKGVIAIVIYPGHPQGKVEDEKISEFVSFLPQKQYDVITYKFINQINNPPYALIIERK